MFIRDFRRSYRTYSYPELILITNLCLFGTPVGVIELILNYGVHTCSKIPVGITEITERILVTPQTRGSVDYPSTRGIQVDVGLPDATSENRAESPLYGELYPNTILVYNLHLPVSNNPIYAIYIKYGHLGP